MDPRASVGAASSTSSMESLSDYFKMSRLGNLEAAERHHRASRVTQLRDIEIASLPPNALCECCSFPIDAQPFPLTALESLSELGVAFPLYFHLNRHIILMLLIVSVVAAIPNTILYLELGTESSLPLTRFSISEHSGDVPYWSMVLHLISVIVLLFVYNYTTLRMKSLMANLDNYSLTPSNFAVLVKNLGSDWSSDELKSHIEKSMQIAGNQIQVAQINTCYDIIEFERIINRIRQIKLKQDKYYRQQSLQPSALSRCWSTFLSVVFHRAGPITKEEIKADIKSLNEAIALVAKCEWKKNGVAIVVFETNLQAKEFINRWRKTPIQRYLCCCISNVDEELNFNGRRIYVKKAPEPIDVVWGNLKYSRRSRVLTQLLFGAIIIGVLFINLYCISNIAYQSALQTNQTDCEKISQESYSEDSDVGDYYEGETMVNISNNTRGNRGDGYYEGKWMIDSPNNTNNTNNTGGNDDSYYDDDGFTETCGFGRVSLLSFCIGYSLILLNQFIKILSRIISAVEHHHSFTTKTLFVSWKLIVFLSLNLILFPLLVNSKKVFEDIADGLASDIFLGIIIQAFFIPLADLLWPMIFALKRRYYRNRFRSNAYVISQDSLNKQFESPEVDLTLWYVGLICKFLLTLAYTPFIPIIAPIMCCGITFEYWVKKYTLLRLSRRPVPINHRLPTIVMRFLKPAMILYALGMKASCLKFGVEDKNVSNAALAISILFLCIPVSTFRRCFRKLLPRPKEKIETKYEEAVNYFFSVSDSQRYEQSNPVTRMQELAENEQDASALKQVVFDEEAKPKLPMASLCSPRSRLQSKVFDVAPTISISSDYVRMSDTQINS